MQRIKQDPGNAGEEAMEERLPRHPETTACEAQTTQPPKTIHLGETVQPTSDQNTGDQQAQIHWFWNLKSIQIILMVSDIGRMLNV